MSDILLNLRTQPTFLSSGDWIAQTAAAYGANNLNAGISVPIEDIQILPDTPNRVLRNLQDGTSRITHLGRPRRNLRVSTDLTLAQMEELNRMLDSGRPLAVGAWFDESTHWMSHFGGQGFEASVSAGLGEIGDTDYDTCLRRDNTDYAPDPFVGDQRLSQRPQTVLSKNTPKIVPGMVGGAILLESARANIAVKRKAASGSGIWTTAGNAIKQRCLVGPPIEPQAGQTEYIILPYDGSTSYVKSGTQTVVAGLPYCISIWVRGTGQILLGAYEGGAAQVLLGSGVLDHRWRRLTLTGYTAGSTSMEVRIRAELTGGGTPAAIETFGLQIEQGYGPCASFMDYSTAPTTRGDGIQTSDQMVWTGYTFIFWLKWRNDNDEKYLYSVGNAGTNHYALIQGTAIALVYKTGSQKTFFITPPTDGSWVQIGITYRSGITGANKAAVSCFVNGVQIGQQEISDAIGLNGNEPSNNIFYVGCDIGLASPTYKALMMPLDSGRLDERVWSAQEFADDYALRTNPGYQRLMNLFEGRYFDAQVSATDQGNNLDQWRVTLDLKEIDIRRQSVR